MRASLDNNQLLDKDSSLSRNEGLPLLKDLEENHRDGYLFVLLCLTIRKRYERRNSLMPLFHCLMKNTPSISVTFLGVGSSFEGVSVDIVAGRSDVGSCIGPVIAVLTHKSLNQF